MAQTEYFDNSEGEHADSRRVSDDPNIGSANNPPDDRQSNQASCYLSSFFPRYSRDMMFVGRDQIFQKLRDAFENTDDEIGCKLVTLRGPVGSGKTFHSLRVLLSGRGRVFLHALGRGDQHDGGLGKFHRIIDSARAQGAADWRSRRDHCRRVKGRKGGSSLFPAQLNGGHILVTTREPVDPNDESSVVIDLDDPEMRMSTDEALHLLDFAKAADFEVRNVIEELNRLPLAVSLAGALIRAHGMTAKEFLDEFRGKPLWLNASAVSTLWPSASCAAARSSIPIGLFRRHSFLVNEPYVQPNETELAEALHTLFQFNFFRGVDKKVNAADSGVLYLIAHRLVVATARRCMDPPEQAN
ncbi:hypothetical protein BC938DRAFT_479680, partial [Jimgerdemannia flammicorona]